MTVRVLGLESGVTSLEDHRHLVGLFQGLGPSGILERRPGIVPSDGAADLTTASAMQADIAPCVAWIDGTSTSSQGGYPFVSDATETLTFSDGDATNDRIDRVVAQIRDDPYDGSGETDGRVVIVEGTAASPASPPAIPASSIPLYRVDVAAGTSAGSGGIDFGADVTDDREYTAALGGVLIVTAGTSTQTDWPGSPYEGQVIYSLTDKVQYIWDGSAWLDLSVAGAIDFDQSATSANLALSGSFQNAHEFSYTPPAGWSTYKLQATGLSMIAGVNSNDAVETALSFQGGGGAGMVIDDNAGSDTRALPSSHSASGLSGTVGVRQRVRNTTASRGTSYSCWLHVIAVRES